jgi:hypothetical protein
MRKKDLNISGLGWVFLFQVFRHCRRRRRYLPSSVVVVIVK